MRFEIPWLLWAAPVLAALAWALAAFARRQRILLARRWSGALGDEAARHGGQGARLLGLAVLVATVAAAGPRIGRVEAELESRALNLVLAVDISRSMLAEDTRPNRLSRAVSEARRVLLDAAGDRIGLIAFAGRSYILSPLTLDGGTVGLYLDHLHPDIASEGGTELAAVLRQGGELLGAATQGGDRVLVIFTDGEGHDSLPVALAQAARLRTAGVSVVFVAQGGAVPVRIPLRDTLGTLTGYQEHDGEPVETRRRDDILQALAGAAGGTLIGAAQADQARGVREVLASLERRPARERRMEDLVPRAWIGALLAFLLLLGHSASRRTAALTGLLLAVVAGEGGAQRPGTGQRLLERGERPAAAEVLRREAERRRTSDTAWYNAGTAALAAGRLSEARTALATAARSVDADLRFRALYNLGVAALLEARADSARREPLLEEAVGNLRQAVLLRPDAQAARWNLELATRERPPPAPGGGRGGQSPPPSRSGAAPPQPAGGALSTGQAEAILAAIEQAERAVRAGQVERRRGMSARAGRNWE
jgi:Ca-activated chloride channel family protein